MNLGKSLAPVKIVQTPLNLFVDRQINLKCYAQNQR